jgi:phosphoserine phosphatase
MNEPAQHTHEQAADRANEPGNWYPENLARIDRGLTAILARGPAERPVAVFDFDNTCVFRDVGQAVFFHQLTGLRYRLHPEELAGLLPTAQADLDGRPMGAVIDTLVASYRRLWPMIEAGEAEAARQLPEAELFAALLLWFTDRARRDQRLGPRYVLPFMGKLLAGYDLAGLRQFAAEVVRAALGEPLVEATLLSTAAEPLGRLQASHPLGLQPHPEMLSLMHRLQGLGIDCAIISASTEWLVEEAVRLFGFPVPPERIFGIRVGLDLGSRLTTGDPDDYPVTYRQGKVEVIRRFLPGRPVLVAGDADTDYEMLTLPDVDLRLLVNRNQSGLISTLYQDPRILLQGLDQATGRFRPFRESKTL